LQTDNLSRLERRLEQRARYRRRRLAAVAILAGLFFGVGTQVAVFFQADGIEAKNAAHRVGRVGTAQGDPGSYQGSLSTRNNSTTISAEEGDAPAYETTGGLVASRSQEPTTKDGATSEANHDAVHKASGDDSSNESEEVAGETLNVLVLGVDRRPSAAEGSSTRSDTIMLVQITPGTGRVELLSVPRDLYVEVEPGHRDRINTAYTYGGIDQARAVMEGLTGVQIDSYVIVDFEGFEEIIDAIGGVKVDVGHGVFPEKRHMGEGVQRLGGHKALFYARYRGTPRADLDRIEHQQRLLAALRKKALRWNTVTKLPQIVKVANENVDTDFGILQVIPLARALVLHGREGQMTSSELKGRPTYLPDGAQVLMPNDEANERILQDFRQ
jgi:polyisoprenyl-teichoic acid--peptidoglycan teichoic acid transferase